MKKLLILTLIIIIIPFVVYSLFYQEQEKEFNIVENTFVRVKRSSTGNIEVVPLEEYVVGVVSGEMPISFHIEALKAQSVAARSYVYKKIEQNKNNSYDVVDTVSNQVYLDNQTLKKNWGSKYTKNINKVREAVFNTQGQYLVYEGEVINAFFFSTSVGKTENSEDIFTSALPYLRSVDSLWDKDVSPVFSVQNKFTLEEFYHNLNLSYKDKISYKVLDTTSTGRIKKIIINDKTFTGAEIASALSLRSSYFSLEQDQGNVYITTKGYGHGVGMSQYGAYGMANAGYKYDEILKYYYQKTELKKL